MKTTLMALGMATALLIGGGAFAQGSGATQNPAPQKKAMAQPTKAQREQMATLHDKMAECLRSDKTMAECHKEMWQSCQAMTGNKGCPMWGGMHPWMHKHMGRGGMMGPNGGMGGTSSDTNSDTGSPQRK